MPSEQNKNNRSKSGCGSPRRWPLFLNALYNAAMISVIIPTLNAQATLAATLSCLIGATVQGIVREVIVVDGGSHDDTGAIAHGAGATILRTEPGRGRQLMAGAAAAKCQWLLFLHGDTVLDEGWAQEAARFVERPEAIGVAGAFDFALDDFSPAARRLERMVRWRCKWLGLPYGDQGLLMSRHLYENIGGFRDMPLMEDVDMVRRLGRRRLIFFRSKAVTSAARYRRDGFVARPMRNALTLSLFFLRVSPRWLARLYG